MTILKRFEIWILLLLVGGAVAFVLWSRDSDGVLTNPAPQPVTGVPEDAKFTVDSTRLKRDYENAILEIDVTCRNEGAENLELIPPTARLLIGPDPAALDTAEEISPFFLAFAPPPSIPPGDTATITLKYWLEQAHLKDALWLRINEDVAPVKSAAPFNLESIPDQQTTSFDGIEWSPSP